MKIPKTTLNTLLTTVYMSKKLFNLINKNQI